MNQIKITTRNCRGLVYYAKHRDLFHYLKIKDYDIMLLQETHCEGGNHEWLWSNQWGNKIWFSSGTRRVRGVAIIFKKTLDVITHNVIKDEAGRYLILYVSFLIRR